MNNNDIPVWEKYTLTIEEASKYFRIGENKLRRLAEENKDAGWLIMNGNRIQIKRRQFEKVIDKFILIDINPYKSANLTIHAVDKRYAWCRTACQATESSRSARNHSIRAHAAWPCCWDAYPRAHCRNVRCTS